MFLRLFAKCFIVIINYDKEISTHSKTFSVVIADKLSENIIRVTENA